MAAPYVRAALLCERVTSDVDGTLSAIRILHEGPVSAAPVRVVLLLMLVRGELAPGAAHARLAIRDPAGAPVSRLDVALDLDDNGGPEQINSLALDVSFAPEQAGVYWFRVTWGDDDQLLTQVPFTARHAR